MSERARRDCSADWRDSRQTGAMAAQSGSRRTGEKALGEPAEPTGPGPAHARGVARPPPARAKAGDALGPTSPRCGRGLGGSARPEPDAPRAPDSLSL